MNSVSLVILSIVITLVSTGVSVVSPEAETLQNKIMKEKD